MIVLDGSSVISSLIRFWGAHTKLITEKNELGGVECIPRESLSHAEFKLTTQPGDAKNWLEIENMRIHDDQ